MLRRMGETLLIVAILAISVTAMAYSARVLGDERAAEAVACLVR